MAKSREVMLRCRVFGHAWDEVPVGRVVDEYVSPPGYREVIALQCMRCSAVRLDSWNRWGVLGGRRYIYEDEYRELNEDLRENAKPGDSSWLNAKKRYIALRHPKNADQEAS